MLSAVKSHNMEGIIMAEKKANIRAAGWKVDKVRATRDKDSITWEAVGGDVTLWFPPGRDPLGIGESTISAGQTLTKSVPKEVKRGTYEYSMFFHQDNEMAEGGSPPIIIID